jgi:hypothetical protein
MLTELRKVGGSFGLATQSLAYLDKMEKTLRATVMANIDHLFAFAMAAQDAQLLRELEGVEVEDITNLDNYMCYVRASLGTKRLPVFSLTIDPPTSGDEKRAQWIRWRSQQRDARPAAVVDEMLATSSARASSPNPTRRGKQGQKMGERFLTPTGQTHEEQQENTGTRRKRHPSKAKIASTREQAAQTSKEKKQADPGDLGWSRPLLCEGVGPGEWGREEQEHGT